MRKKLRLAAVILGAASVASLVLSTTASAAPVPVNDAGVRVAAAAAAPTGSVNSASVLDNSLTGVDVKDRSLGEVDMWGPFVDSMRKVFNNGVDSSAKIAPGVIDISDLNAALAAKVNAPDKDTNPLGGAYYAVAFYDVGDTNAGAIATVGCSKDTDTAISGGVQILGLDATANSRNTPVSSSFPGRMDWTTNTPKADRLDGWIVQFGGNAGTVSDKDPLKVKIWALCTPGLNIPVVETFTQSK